MASPISFIPGISDIQAAKLRLLVEPWNRADLTVEAAGTISSITDSKAGAAFVQATGADQPLTSNGARKVPLGDGLSKHLATAAMGWALANNFSCFGVGHCALDAGVDVATHALFAFGASGVTSFKVHRLADGGLNKLQVQVGDGVGSTISVAAGSPTIAGGFYWWADVTAADVTFYVNGTLVGTYAVVPGLTLTRARLLAAAGPTATQWAKLNLGLIGLSSLNTGVERAATSALLAGIATQILAA